MQANHNNQNDPSARVDSSELRQCLFLDIDRISYSDALALQHKFHAQCVSLEIPGMLMLLEHNPVLTMGVKESSHRNVLASPEILRAQGVELVETDRGGDVTYHGPGQLVGYPILRLRDMGGDLHAYLRNLEQTVIDTLAVFGLEGHRSGPAGVWVGDKKICSIGIAIRKWVTYHGFALNVNPNLSHFCFINPCGLASEQMTSMAELLEKVPEMKDVKEAYVNCFARVFNLDIKHVCGDS